MNRRLWITLALAALVFGLGGAAMADSPTEAVAEGESAPTVMRGLQLFIDADTGELRPPTAKEAASLAEQNRKMFGATEKVEPQVFRYKSGITGIEVPNYLLKFSAARVEADGSLTMGCIQGPQKTLEFITSTSTNGPAEE